MSVLITIAFLGIIISRIASRISKAMGEIQNLPEHEEPHPVVEMPSDADAGYFTYESELSDKEFYGGNEVDEKSQVVMRNEAIATEPGFSFDLRQAVIGQVILQNPYLYEEVR